MLSVSVRVPAMATAYVAPAVAQAGDLRRRVAQPGQDLRRVLARQRRRVTDGRRRAGQREGHARQADRAGRRVVDGGDHVRATTCGSLNAWARSLSGPLGTSAAASAASHASRGRVANDRVEDRPQLGPVGQREPRSWRSADRRPAAGRPMARREAGPLPFAADRHRQLPVGRPEGLVRRDVGVLVAHAAGRQAADQVVGGLVGQPGEGRLQQREVDALAAPAGQRCGAVSAAPTTREQRGQHGHGAEHAGGQVADGDPDLGRPAAVGVRPGR